MNDRLRIQFFGGDDDRAALERAGLDVETLGAWPERPDGVFVVAADLDPGAFSGGSVWTACLAARSVRDPSGRVFVVVEAGVDGAEGLARFCLADGVLWRSVGDDGSVRLEGVDELRIERGAAGGRVEVDALLERLERDLEARGEQAAERALERLRQAPDDSDLLPKLTDPETGLFDGPFAVFKIDDELKRAVRFHQPFSILLIECRVRDWGPQRNLALAELAGIFLEECRDIDAVARFDESTFLFLLPGTPPAGARALAGRLGEAIRGRSFSGGVEPDARIGVAVAPDPHIRTRQDLLAAAERDLALSSEG